MSDSTPGRHRRVSLPLMPGRLDRPSEARCVLGVDGRDCLAYCPRHTPGLYASLFGAAKHRKEVVLGGSGRPVPPPFGYATTEAQGITR